MGLKARLNLLQTTANKVSTFVRREGESTKLTKDGLALLKSDSRINPPKINDISHSFSSITLPQRLLSKEEFLFFSENLKGKSKEEIEIALDEIFKLKYENSKSMFRIIPKNLDDKFNALTYSTRALLEMKFNNRQQYNDVLKLIGFYNTGKIKYRPNFIMPNGKLNNLVKQDMESILSGRNYYEEFGNNTIINGSLLNNINMGDVFSVGEKMYVKTKNGYIPLKMDKQTYKLLFPPVDRYAIAQGQSHHCPYLSAINNLVQVPENRIKMYQMFEQQGNLIYVHPLGNPNKITTFDLNKLSELDKDLYAETSYGNRMLEKMADPLENGRGIDNSYMYDFINENHTMFPNINTTNATLLNDDPLAYGFKSSRGDRRQQCVIKAHQRLQTIGNGKTMITSLGNGNEYGIGNDHCCSVFDCQNGVIKFANPHGTAFYQEVPLDKFYGEDLTYFNHGFFDNV